MIDETPKADRAASGGERGSEDFRPKHVFFALAALFFLNLLLRVFYLRYDFVNGDEAVRALTAVRVLEGARLYVDVITDKPPGATLFYAAVISLFGRSMPAVHVAAAIWNFATSLVIYFTAAKFCGKRAGLWAALMFVYFSTSYHTQDMMAANTELLMALPYVASFYFFVTSRRAKNSGREFVSLISAGLMAGVAVIFKQVGVFNLVFFFLYEVASIYGARAPLARMARRSFVRLTLVAAGFVSVLLLQFGWLYSMGALAGFWRNAVVLGRLYISSLPTDLWLKFLVSRTLAYIGFNAPLWALALLASARAVTWWLKKQTANNQSSRVASVESNKDEPAQSPHVRSGAWDDNHQPRFDVALVLWGSVSLFGVFTSGRFFGHYFIQVLPALSLLAAIGIAILKERLANVPRLRGAVVYALVLLFIFSFIRFHHRTAVLAYETLTGARTRWSESWGMDRRQREVEMIAGTVSKEIGEGEPLYIWGYALDVYWRSGCRPASRYLTPYYVTGHFYPEVITRRDAAGEQFWAEARAQLIEDLKQAQPRLILNIDEAILSLPYSEVVDFIKKNYRYEGQIGSDPSRPFLVFRLKNKKDKDDRKKTRD